MAWIKTVGVLPPLKKTTKESVDCLAARRSKNPAFLFLQRKKTWKRSRFDIYPDHIIDNKTYHIFIKLVCTPVQTVDLLNLYRFSHAFFDVCFLQNFRGVFFSSATKKTLGSVETEKGQVGAGGGLDASIFLGGGNSFFCLIFTPGEIIPSWQAYFSNGLKRPPTRFFFSGSKTTLWSTVLVCCVLWLCGSSAVFATTENAATWQRHKVLVSSWVPKK